MTREVKSPRLHSAPHHHTALGGWGTLFPSHCSHAGVAAPLLHVRLAHLSDASIVSLLQGTHVPYCGTFLPPLSCLEARAASSSSHSLSTGLMSSQPQGCAARSLQSFSPPQKVV